MNESLSTQLKQAAFVLMHRLANELKIAELKKRIADKEKELKNLRWDVESIERPSKRNWLGLLLVSVFWLFVSIIANNSGCAICALVHFAISMIFFVNYQIKTKSCLKDIAKKKSKIEKIEKELPKIKEECQAEIGKTEKILNECWEEGKQFLDFLPNKYRNADAVCFMFDAVENCRADSLKETINLYEDELRYRKERVEKNLAAEQQTAYMQNLQSMLQNIGESQDAINSNLTEIKTMQFFDMMNKN